MPINFQPLGYGSTQRDAFAEDALGKGLPLNATIVEREDLSQELARIVVRPDGWQVKPFEPGQYADLAMQPRESERPGGGLDMLASISFEHTRRSYSIASIPGQLDRLEFFFNLVPTGTFTPSLWRLNEGDRLHLDPRIRGRFTLRDVPEDADLLMIGTGTGAAPFFSILRHYTGKNRWRRAAFIQTARRPAELALRNEMEALAKREETLRYLPTVTRSTEEENWQGLTVRPQELLTGGKLTEMTGIELNPERTHVFLCGNPKMIQTTMLLLQDRGFSPASANRPGTLHTESYW